MKHNKGFSLVELIVVIAIMAILVGVAVPVYSSYVEKSQKAADTQLIDEIQHAIRLHGALNMPTPGQSGYIVIHRNEGTGENGGNVSIGGQLDEFLTNALVSSFGPQYGESLQLSYQNWTGVLTTDEVGAIINSSYYDNTDDLMQTVQMLTSALKGYYGPGATDQMANQAVLDVAANTGLYVNKEAFVAWWSDITLVEQGPGANTQFTFPAGTDSDKTCLAAQYAKYKAIVLAEGCTTCQSIFGDETAFNSVTRPEDAFAALQTTISNAKAHADGCLECGGTEALVTRYYTGEKAANDAKAYLALLGQVDAMSEQISSSDEFLGDGLYTSDFISDAVNEYIITVDTFNTAINDVGAQAEGDIIIVAIALQNGSIMFKTNLPEQ